jgi:carotenoid 1,2-hydratase
VLIDERGEAQTVAAPPERPLRRAGWGVQRHPRADGPLHLVRTLEDTPFYTRSLLRREGEGGTLPMVHESLSMERFERGWVRCLLPFRMPRELRAHGAA